MKKGKHGGLYRKVYLIDLVCYCTCFRFEGPDSKFHGVIELRLDIKVQCSRMCIRMCLRWETG